MAGEPSREASAAQKSSKTKLGLPLDIECVLCYVLQWLSGFVFLLVEQRDALVRFHAALSVMIFVPVQLVLAGYYIIWVKAAPAAVWLRFIGWAVYGLVVLGMLALWGWLILQAYRCAKPDIPVLSRLADRVVWMTTNLGEGEE